MYGRHGKKLALGNQGCWAVLGQRHLEAVGNKSSGKRLIAALNSPNENLRTLAGIFLVRSGRRAIPLLEQELANRRNLPRILILLGDMDEPESEEHLKKYLGDHDPKVADTAKQAMRNLLFKHGHC